MDRDDLNKDANMQVTLEEIVNELNKQIANLNFELTVNKLALQKIQVAFADYVQNNTKKTKKIADDF